MDPAQRSIVSGVDQGSILLIVYSAFSEAVGEAPLAPGSAFGLGRAGLVADGALLAAALITTTLVSKWLGFERADRVSHRLLRRRKRACLRASP